MTSLLFIMTCPLFIMTCILFIMTCILFITTSLLFIMTCPLFIKTCLLFIKTCLLFKMTCLLFKINVTPPEITWQFLVLILLFVYRNLGYYLCKNTALFTTPAFCFHPLFYSCFSLSSRALIPTFHTLLFLLLFPLYTLFVNTAFTCHLWHYYWLSIVGV